MNRISENAKMLINPWFHLSDAFDFNRGFVPFKPET